MNDAQEAPATEILFTGSGAEGPPKLPLRNPHSLIRRTMDIKIIKDQYGYEARQIWPGVDTRVSKSAKRNALIVLDRLFKGLDAQGVEVSVIEGGGYNSSLKGT